MLLHGMLETVYSRTSETVVAYVYVCTQVCFEFLAKIDLDAEIYYVTGANMCGNKLELRFKQAIDSLTRDQRIA